MEELKKPKVQQNDQIDLIEIFSLLLRKAWIVVLCLIVGGTLAFGWTKLRVTPMYTASSTIYVLTKTTTVTSIADLQLGSQLTNDFVILAKSRPVIETVIEDLDLDYTYEAVSRMISITNEENTRIVKFSVSHADPEMAKNIANSVAEATAERIAYIMNTDKPKIVEEAVEPTVPSSPNVLRNIEKGALLGAGLAIAVIMLLYLLNDTLQTEADVLKYLDLNVLAVIPAEKEKRK